MAERRRRRRTQNGGVYGGTPARRGRPPKAPTSVPEDMDEYEFWKTRVAHARKVREDWEREWKVPTLERYILGKHGQPHLTDENSFNHFGATIKAMKPNLAMHAPKFYVRPQPWHEREGTENQSRQAEAVLDSIALQDDHLADSSQRAVWQSFTRMGVLKCCYDPSLEPNPQKGLPVWATDADGQPLMQHGVPIQDLDPSTGLVMVEPDEVMKDEIYRWDWVDAGCMLLPDAGPDMRHWPWIGEEVTVTLNQAKSDGRFPKALRDQFVSNASTRRPKETARTPRPPGVSREEFFRYIECYDLIEKKCRIWAEEQPFEEFLVNDPIGPGVEDHPYCLLRYLEILAPDPSPWPLPLTYDWLDVQDEYNIRRRQITEGAKRAARKGVFQTGTFKDEEAARAVLSSPHDMEFTEVNMLNSVQMLDVPPLSADIWKDLTALLGDWRIITGQTGARLGTAEGETATESVFVERAANLRDVDLQAAVHRWMGMAGRKMLQLLKGTLTLDVYAKMRGFSDNEFKKFVQQRYGVDVTELMFLPGIKELFRLRYGEEKWQKVTREDLTFEAEVQVVPGSMRPRTLEMERRQWMEFLSIIGKFPQLALSRELLRETANKFEYVSERLLDELVALAKQMVAINANQAGRNQGGAGPESTPPVGAPAMTGAPLLQALGQTMGAA